MYCEFKNGRVSLRLSLITMHSDQPLKSEVVTIAIIQFIRYFGSHFSSQNPRTSCIHRSTGQNTLPMPPEVSDISYIYPGIKFRFQNPVHGMESLQTLKKGVQVSAAFYAWYVASRSLNKAPSRSLRRLLLWVPAWNDVTKRKEKECFFFSTMVQLVAGLMWTLYLFHQKFPTDLTVFMFRRHGKKTQIRTST